MRPSRAVGAPDGRDQAAARSWTSRGSTPRVRWSSRNPTRDGSAVSCSSGVASLRGASPRPSRSSHPGSGRSGVTSSTMLAGLGHRCPGSAFVQLHDRGGLDRQRATGRRRGRGRPPLSRSESQQVRDAGDGAQLASPVHHDQQVSRPDPGREMTPPLSSRTERGPAARSSTRAPQGRDERGEPSAGRACLPHRCPQRVCSVSTWGSSLAHAQSFALARLPVSSSDARPTWRVPGRDLRHEAAREGQRLGAVPARPNTQAWRRSTSTGTSATTGCSPDGAPVRTIRRGLRSRADAQHEPVVVAGATLPQTRSTLVRRARGRG